MTKCDFCTESKPNGKCYWDTQVMRRKHCEEAIERMTKAFENGGNKHIRCNNLRRS